MPLCKRETKSGAVLEYEFYSVSDRVRNIGDSKPKFENIRTLEEKEQYNRHKSEKRFVRLVNTNFNSRGFYVTATYNNEHLPPDYAAAVTDRDNYFRRLQYLYPNAKIIAVTGYGSQSGRLHHHFLISGVLKKDISSKWTGGKVVKIEHLRKDNSYNGINCGEDFTKLAVYLHKHAPANHKGKRWKQTKTIEQPEQEKAKAVKREFTPEHPPKAPKGYVFIEAKANDYGYMYFKYVKEVKRQPEPPIFSEPKPRAGISARL